MGTKNNFLEKIKEKIIENKQYDVTNMKRPLDNDNVSSSLMPIKSCFSAYNYLFQKNHFKTIDIIKELDKLMLNETMNPHAKKYSPKEYYVKTDTTNNALKKLNDLCSTDDNKMNLSRLAKDGATILHIGEKGNGKTLVQNIWLYDNYSWFEQNNIIWARCDAHKLYDLWRDSDTRQLASIEDYLYGQLVYVFCKYLKTSKYCKDGKESKLFAKIYNELKNHEYNTQPYTDSRYSTGKNVYKRDVREQRFSSALHFFQTEKVELERELRSITDWIDKFHQDITSNVREEKKEFSYWLNILKEAQQKPESSNRVKNLWVLIGMWIEHVIINLSPTKYYFLHIVDGINNTPLNNSNNVREYKSMIRQLTKA